jgi:hypothetical protein
MPNATRGHTDQSIKINTWIQLLPAHQQLSDSLELAFGQTLGEDVCLLLGGLNPTSFNALVFANVASEEMVLQRQVLVPG